MSNLKRAQLAYNAYVRAAELTAAPPWAEVSGADRDLWQDAVDGVHELADIATELLTVADEHEELADNEAVPATPAEDLAELDEYDYSDRAENAELDEAEPSDVPR